MLRLMESRLGITLVASGAIYAVRRSCYPTLPADTLTDDLVVPLAVRRQGFRVLYDPEARATDFAASNVAGEFTRRVRVATGSFRCLRDLVRTPMDPLTAFAFFSHKFLRWVLPFLLLGLLASMRCSGSGRFYRGVLIAQGLFYLWAALGFLAAGACKESATPLIAYYLLAIHRPTWSGSCTSWAAGGKPRGSA
jgi:cellulose synthase/poly-beta-1,6-N-acetylglucosamine synthase-like glycosyltransferase